MRPIPPRPVAALTPTHQLLRSGWTSRQLSRAVAIGELTRVRQGWYCPPALDELSQRAARVGGQLTCQSAARMLGLAARQTDTLHVSVPRNAARLRDSRDARSPLSAEMPRDTVVHWSGGTLGSIVEARTALEVVMDMAICESPEFTIAAVDSAIRLGLVSRSDWLAFLPSLPQRLAALLAQVDGHSESITESVCRVRLRAVCIEPALQVKIVGVGFVDMLIGDRLVIEIDGRKYHTDTQQFEADRQRDARLSILGYRVLRFSYRQVMSNWAQVRESIQAAITRGDQLA